MSTIQLHLELRVGQSLDDLALYFNRIFLRHTPPLFLFSKSVSMQNTSGPGYARGTFSASIFNCGTESQFWEGQGTSKMTISKGHGLPLNSNIHQMTSRICTHNYINRRDLRPNFSIFE